MGAYKNDYKKNEDQMLWELHEIRHELHKEFKKKSIDQINKEALAKYNQWKKEREERLSAAG